MTRYLLMLTIAFAGGGVSIWLLRQPWAKTSFWPWLLLILIMFIAGASLQKLDRWLPGERIQSTVASSSRQSRRVIGITCIGVAFAFVALIVVRLWPDYHKWQGTFPYWLAALALMLIGARLVSAVGQPSSRAGTAIRIWPDTRRNRVVEAAAFVCIFILAIFLRFYQIDTIPPGIYVDETNGALDALRMLEGNDASPFATGWYETPNGYLYYMAAIFKFLGANWISLKLVSLIPAVLSVAAVYYLGRLLFGPSVGLGAMMLMAVSRWHLSMSRWGWNEVVPPFFQVLTFFFLIRGLRDRRALDYALGGLFMGLSLYTYLSSRLAAATLILFIAYWLLSDPAGWRVALRRSWLGLLILISAAIVTVGPLLVTYITNPFSFNNRVSEINIFREVNDTASITPLVQNVVDILKFFHQTGDLQGKHNLPGEPMTDPITGLLFAVGVAYSLIAWRDYRRVLLLLWLVIGLSGSILSSPHESPQSYRTLTALPAVVLIAADVLDRTIRALLLALNRFPITLVYPRISSLAAGVTAIIALAGATIWESAVYFGPQVASISVLRGFNPTENGVAREVLAALSADKTVYLSPGFFTFSPLRFLVYGLMKSVTGENTLDAPPYKVVLPEVDLPLPDDGHAILLLLDRDYWPLRDYLASFYTQATMDLITLSDNSPIYMRVELSQQEVMELQGLTERVTYADGRQVEKTVTEVSWSGGDPLVTHITWQGAIRIEHGGIYNLQGEGLLQVFLDGQPFVGRHYLGRGLYGLRVVQSRGISGSSRLTWQIDQSASLSVPPEVFFRIPSPQQGLLASYFRKTNWEGTPVFQQVTPFLLLAWPTEQPLVPNGAFSARFDGMLRVEEPKLYGLRVDADDGARLTLDGVVLGEGLIPNRPNRFEVNIELTSGDHSLQIDYFQQGGGSTLRVFWRQDEDPWTPIPPTALVPAPL